MTKECLHTNKSREGKVPQVLAHSQYSLLAYVLLCHLTIFDTAKAQ